MSRDDWVPGGENYEGYRRRRVSNRGRDHAPGTPRPPWERWDSELNGHQLHPVDDFPDLVQVLQSRWASKYRIFTAACQKGHALVRVYQTPRRRVVVFQAPREEVDGVVDHFDPTTGHEQVTIHHRALTWAFDPTQRDQPFFTAECKCGRQLLVTSWVLAELASGRKRAVVTDDSPEG